MYGKYVVIMFLLRKILQVYMLHKEILSIADMTI
nr:MAG TPA: hypothetical protein [Bacteriophage sp.]